VISVSIDKVPSRAVETTRERGDDKVVMLTIGTLSHCSGTCVGRSRARNEHPAVQAELTRRGVSVPILSTCAMCS